MKETKKATIGYFQIAGFILLIPSIVFWILWIITFESNPTASQVEKRELFFSYFPSIIQNSNVIDVIIITTLILAIIFSWIRFKNVKIYFKILGILSIIIGSLIFLLQIFTLL